MYPPPPPPSPTLKSDLFGSALTFKVKAYSLKPIQVFTMPLHFIRMQSWLQSAHYLISCTQESVTSLINDTNADGTRTKNTMSHSTWVGEHNII